MNFSRKTQLSSEIPTSSMPDIIFMLLISSLILGCNSTENSADKAQNSRDALSAQNFSQKSKKEHEK